jgi:hypothetical protein
VVARSKSCIVERGARCTCCHCSAFDGHHRMATDRRCPAFTHEGQHERCALYDAASPLSYGTSTIATRRHLPAQHACTRTHAHPTVQNLLTILAAGSTSSRGTGVPALKLSMPRRVHCWLSLGGGGGGTKNESTRFQQHQHWQMNTSMLGGLEP